MGMVNDLFSRIIVGDQTMDSRRSQSATRAIDISMVIGALPVGLSGGRFEEVGVSGVPIREGVKVGAGGVWTAC
jgi:hypothetical protein